MKSAFLLFALGSLAVLTSCQRPSAVQETPAGARASAPVPAWQMKLDVPENIPVGKPVDLQVRVFEETGQPAGGANVEVSLRMTTMDMGENKTKLTERQPGVYAGKGTFSMAGQWDATVTASKEGATLESKFPVLVK